MMRKTILAWMGLGTALVCGSAQADLGMNGETGGRLNPTADTAPVAHVSLAASVDSLGTTPAPSNRLSLIGVQAATGLPAGFEVSGAWQKLRVSGAGPLSPLDKSGVALGGKYVLPGNHGGWKVAAGAGISTALLDNRHAYLVATRSLGVQPVASAQLSLGLRYDHFSLGDIGGPHSNKVSVYGVASVRVTPWVAVTGELQSRNAKFTGSTTPYSLGVSLSRPGSPFNLSVGVERQGLVDDSGAYLQLGCTLP